MARISLCVLLLSNFLSFGHSQERAVLTLEPKWSPIFTGETVTFTCDMKEGKKTDWLYTIYNGGFTLVRESVQNKHSFQAQLNHSGEYKCIGTKTLGLGSGTAKLSNGVTLTVSEIPAEKAVLTLEPKWSPIFTGETVTFTCDLREGPETDWLYTIFNGGFTLVRESGQNKHSFQAQLNHNGEYKCLGTKTLGLGLGTVRRSNGVTLTVSDKPKATLKADQTVLPVEGSVTLTCSVEVSSGWKYYGYQNDTNSLIDQYSTGSFNVSQGGRYWCRGGRGETLYYTEYSDPVTIVSQPPAIGSTQPPATVDLQSSAGLITLIVGLVVVIPLSILLVVLLLRRYRTAPCCVRPSQSQGTNQGSAAVQMTNQSGPPDDLYSTLQHGDTSVYGVIHNPDADYENDPGCVRAVQSQGTNQGSAVGHQSGPPPDGVYCALQHGDKSIYGVIDHSEDYENV